MEMVSDGKAAESQRLFRRRQETGIAQDCVVELAEAQRSNDLKGLQLQTSLKAPLARNGVFPRVANTTATAATTT